MGTWILRWNGKAEDFQEECYDVPDIVQDEFQAVQGEITWVARRGQDTSDHLAFVEHELKCLWAQVQLEQKYLRYLIKEHILSLQSSFPSSSCQCPILGDFRASPVPPCFETSTLRSCLDMSVLLPSSPVLQTSPSSPSGKSSTPLLKQRCCLSCQGC